eukprot:gene12479-14647_t
MNDTAVASLKDVPTIPVQGTLARFVLPELVSLAVYLDDPLVDLACIIQTMSLGYGLTVDSSSISLDLSKTCVVVQIAKAGSDELFKMIQEDKYQVRINGKRATIVPIHDNIMDIVFIRKGESGIMNLANDDAKSQIVNKSYKVYDRNSYIDNKRKDLGAQIRRDFKVQVDIRAGAIRISSPNDKWNEKARDYIQKMVMELVDKPVELIVKNVQQKDLLIDCVNKINITHINAITTLNSGTNAKGIFVTFILTGVPKGVEEITVEINDFVYDQVDAGEAEIKALGLVPADVDKEFKVRIMTTQTSINYCGRKAQVDGFKQWLTSKLKTTGTREQINLVDGEVYLFRKILMPQLLGVTTSPTNIYLSGSPDQVKENKEIIAKFMTRLHCLKVNKVFSKNVVQSLVPFLKDTFKNDMVFTQFTQKKTLEKNNLTGSSSSDIESEDESNNEESEDEISFVDERVDATIVVWLHKDHNQQGILDKVQRIADMKEARTEEVAIDTPEELAYIRKTFELNKNVIVLNNEKKAIVQALWDHDLRALVNDIMAKKLSTLVTKKIKLTKYALGYFRVNEQKDLVPLQTKFAISYKLDVDRLKIVLKGKNSQVRSAKKDLKVTIDDLKTVSFSNKAVDRVDISNLKRVMEDKFKVAMDFDEHTIMVTGTSTAAWDQITNEVGRVGPKEAYFPLKNPMTLPVSFEGDWNVTCRYDVATSRLKVTAKTQEHLKAALDALNDLSNNIQKVNKKVVAPSRFIYLALTRGASKDILETIKTKHHVDMVMDDSVITVSISGPKNTVESAEKEVMTWIQSQKPVKISHSLPIAVAYEVLRPDYCLSFFERNGALIDPIGTTNTTLSLINLKNTLIEIVQGDILQERTECIVNAANSNLAHGGGIAYIIAAAAGPAFVKECDDLVKRSGPIPTGKCTVTGVGNLTSYKCIIHTVAPQWSHHMASKCEADMKSAINSTLSKAFDHHCLSISIPAIGAGIYGVPKDVVAKTIIDSIIDFVIANPSSFKSIRVCDIDIDVLNRLKTNLASREKAIKSIATPSFFAKKPAAKPFQIMYQWQWRENDGSFVAFDPDQSYQIETSFLKKTTAKFTITGDLLMVKNGYQYEIDLVNMTELNTQYRRYPRPILRVKLPNANMSETAYEKSFQNFLVQGSQPARITEIEEFFEEDRVHPQKSIHIWANNDKEAKRARDILDDNVKNTLYESRSVTIPPEHVKAIKSKIESLVRAYDCELLGTDGHLSIKGPRTHVTPARDAVMELVMETIQKSPSNNIKFPWGNDPVQTANLELKTLDHKSQDFQAVSLAFHRTLPTGFRITSIQRIQNKWLYEKYHVSRSLFAKKVKIDIGSGDSMFGKYEMMLFHGTRTVDPEKVYNGEHGFDTRHTTGASFKMFYARVLIGETVILPPNQAITKPPPKGKTHLDGYEEDYDSIGGSTNGSNVFMIYENNKA